MLFVFYDLLKSLAITLNQSINKQWKMVCYKDTPNVAKKAAEVAQKKEQ